MNSGEAMGLLWRAWWIICVCSVVTLAQGQDVQPKFDAPEEYSVAVSFFAPVFIPKFLQDEYRLKEYICSEEFASFRLAYGDLNAVDAIFDRAMKLSWNNVYEGLLLSFLCTLEHRNFGVKLPLLGPLVWLPLTSEFQDEFRHRVNALPVRIYDDTPPGMHGDRDKLQHFFGSAFVTYMTESREAAERMGTFIEWGEDRFVVDGSLDQRDLRANVQGQNFGNWLLNDASVLPSRFLGKSAQTTTDKRGCMPDELQKSVSVFLEAR
ncbi:MAG TPA: hypothetical protein DGH68_00435 [Bacteroidetes bacterium]|jgi:hypothetical protein|nr:hypothetical protein [Bacteroidota bacterium]